MKHRHRGKAARRRAALRRRRLTNIAAAALALIIIALASYIVVWYANRDRIRADGERYRQMYVAQATARPTLEPTPAPTETPTPAPIETPTPAPTETPTDTPTAEPTETPTPAPTPTRIAIPTPTTVVAQTPSPEPARTPSPAPTVPLRTEAPLPTARRIAVPTTAPGSFALATLGPARMPVAPDAPIPTPDEGTLVMALPTTPPVQDSFSELLAHNPDTVGWLDADGVISLPVVQRENDNDYYLDHTFDGEGAAEGALFMDGLNRLSPEDDCLIVYGHNMKNGTMFGRLSEYGDVDFMKQHSIVRFDTIYENRAYVPFAAFSASVEPGARGYFDVRQFLFDEAEFDKFVLKLRGRSRYSVPVEVEYGDRLLLLVTCDYTAREGRFILALRQLRAGEAEANMWAQAMQAEAK